MNCVQQSIIKCNTWTIHVPIITDAYDGACRIQSGTRELSVLARLAILRYFDPEDMIPERVYPCKEEQEREDASHVTDHSSVLPNVNALVKLEYADATGTIAEADTKATGQRW